MNRSTTKPPLLADGVNTPLQREFCHPASSIVLQVPQPVGRPLILAFAMPPLVINHILHITKVLGYLRLVLSFDLVGTRSGPTAR